MKDLKTFALATCVQENYKRINPSFVVNDVTNSFIIPDNYPLSLEKTQAFTQFINNKTSEFSRERPYEGYQANMVFYKCMDFYHSDELSHFIKTLLD